MEFKNAKKTIRFTLILFAFLASNLIDGQNISRPQLKSADLSENLTTACASEDNRSFSATAQITSGTFPAETIFSLQLSNREGTFGTNTLILGTATTNDNSITFSQFEIPETDTTGNLIGSDTYKLRVFVESDGFRGNPSNDLRIYYWTNKRPELRPLNAICKLEPDSELRAVDVFSEYIWYRDGTVIPNESGPVLRPTTTGLYYYTAKLGACEGFFSNVRSNEVRVLNTTSTINVSISAQGPTRVCAEDAVVLESSQTDPSFAYQWVKDGEIISGETGTTLTIQNDIEAEGNYRIEVADNTQSLAARCTTQSNEIFIDLINPTIKITSELNIVDVPGEDEILTAQLGETPQGSQVITWIKDGVDIPNSNTTNFTATGPGVYKVKVADSSSPCTIKEMTSVEEVTIAPVDNLTITIRYDNPAYTDCNFDQISLIATATSNVNGTDVPVNTDNLSISWFKNGVDTGRSGNTIFINTASDNGNYKAVVESSGETFESDELSVILSLGSLTISASPPQLTLGGTSELSVNLPDGAILSDYSFQWQRGVSIPLEGETQPTYTVTNPGTYSVQVTFTGCGQTLVGPVSLESGSNVIPNVLSRNTDGINNNWVLPALIKNNPEFSVEIYTANGKLDFKSGPQGYSGEWPEESQSNLNGTIYYYVISRNDSVLEKGSITIIR